MRACLTTPVRCDIGSVIRGITATRRSHMSSPRPLLFATIALSLLTFVLRAQTTATIVGTVNDESGAAIPKASVKVTNELTGFSRALVTETDGSYVATLLPLGVYTVEGSAPGFKTMVRKGVSLSVQEAAKVDLRLSVGAVADQVTVAGDAPLVDTRQASLGAL